jgi:hypothetical protein
VLAELDGESHLDRLSQMAHLRDVGYDTDG